MLVFIKWVTPAKAQERLLIFANSPEPSLLTHLKQTYLSELLNLEVWFYCIAVHGNLRGPGASR